MNSEAVGRPLLVVIAVVACLALLLLLGPAILAQSGGQYDLSWSAIAGGGESEVTGSDYVLGGAIDQTGAGTSSGGQVSSGERLLALFPAGLAILR